MKVAIRRLGNSQGVIIPKPILAQVGLVAEAEMRVEKGAIVLQKPEAAPRAGWAEASERLASQGDDALVWPEFANEADKDIKWCLEVRSGSSILTPQQAAKSGSPDLASSSRPPRCMIICEP